MKFLRGFLLFGLLFFLAGQLAAEKKYPDPRYIFQWNSQEQLLGYKSVEKMIHTNRTNPSAEVLALNPSLSPKLGAILNDLKKPTEQFLSQGNVVGLLILQDGQKIYEHYQNEFTAADTWTSFSIAKSVTGTLTGLAIKDGYIKSVDDQVTAYIPELKNTAYDGVTIKHLLNMSSGVAWNENYYDPNSDTAKIALGLGETDQGIISALSSLKREAEPGTHFSYKTGESNLLGLVVIRATGLPLAQYLNKKIWQPFGMANTAFWGTDSQGYEMGGCCLSMTLEDYGRFGLYILGGGKIKGEDTLPFGWLKEATTDQFGRGYGYQWHVYQDGSFMASGIFGQTLYLVPQENLVLVSLSAWNEPVSAKFNQARFKYAKKIREVLKKHE